MINAAPFLEAIKRTAVRAILPTNLTSAELSQLSRDLNQNAFVSAQNTLKQSLEMAKSQVLALANGDVDLVTARLELKKVFQQLGYQPDPEKRGTIQDLASTGRTNLVIKTNTQIAQGFGYDRQGQSDAILDQWPAQELFRAEARTKERRWLERWERAGAATGDSIGIGWTIYRGRMIALKNHPIWDALGNSNIFEDGLNNPYPPFAFGSGMDVRDVDRDTAMEIGLIDRDTQIKPRLQRFLQDV